MIYTNRRFDSIHLFLLVVGLPNKLGVGEFCTPAPNTKSFDVLEVPNVFPGCDIIEEFNRVESKMNVKYWKSYDKKWVFLVSK